MKILIVADAAPILFTLEQFLTEQGYHAIAAKSADDALERLSGDPGIEIVLCDLLLRNANGVELLKAAKQISRCDDEGLAPPPRFVFMATPVGGAGDRDERLRNQAKLLSDGDVLPKPIDRGALLARLETVSGPARTASPHRDGRRGSDEFRRRERLDRQEAAELEDGSARLSAIEADQQDLSHRLQRIENRLEKLETMAHVAEAAVSE